jgi:hypothetical protein
VRCKRSGENESVKAGSTHINVRTRNERLPDLGTRVLIKPIEENAA